MLYAIKSLDGLKGANDDQTRGIDIIRKAIETPLRQIAQNAGVDGAVVAGNLLREADETMGFNAATDTYENLVTAGVVDPTKVVRIALAGRGLGRRPADHHRSGDQRYARGQAGHGRQCPAAAWAAWAAWTSKSAA